MTEDICKKNAVIFHNFCDKLHFKTVNQCTLLCQGWHSNVICHSVSMITCERGMWMVGMGKG